MAKRLIKWTLDENILKLTRVLDDTEAKIEVEAEFDLTVIYPDFAEYSDVQKQLIVYGTKQKLADSGANSVGDVPGKVASAKVKWNELLEGKWTGSRVNATGAAQAKKTVNAMNEVAKTVTLEGLVVKKTMSGLPGQPVFTEEDQKKLDEFILAAQTILSENN